jgi:hypothetical protein
VTKQCKKCQKIKDLDQFYKDSKAKDGLFGHCIQCSKEKAKAWYEKNSEKNKQRSRLWHRNNPDKATAKRLRWKRENPDKYRALNLKQYWPELKPLERIEKYNQMVGAQGGKCRICCEIKPLVVDHNHQTSKVRGLLCRKCNGGLGFFEENPGFFHNAVAYLSVEAG